MENIKARNGGFTGTIHINPDHVVTVDGDTAHVSAHMWAAHMVGPEPEDCFWGYGLYEIDLARNRGGVWQLTTQSIELIRTEGASVLDVFRRAMERQASGQGHY